MTNPHIITFILPAMLILTALIAWLIKKLIDRFGYTVKEDIPYTIRRKRIWKQYYAPKGSIFIVVTVKHNGMKYTSFRHIPGGSPREFEEFMAKEEFESLRKKYNF